MIGFLCFLILLVVWTPVLVRLVRRQRLDWLDPLSLFAFYFSAGYVAPVYFFLAGEDTFTQRWGLTYLDQDSIVEALGVAALGAVGFVVGFLWWNPKEAGSSEFPTRPTRMVWEGRRFGAVAILLSLIGLTLFEVGVLALGGWSRLLSGLGDRIRLFAGLNYFVNALNLLLVISLVWWNKITSEPGSPKIAFFVYSLGALAAAALQGSKSVLMVYVVALLAIYQLNARKIRASTIAIMAGCLLLGSSAYALLARELLVAGELVTVDLGREVSGSAGSVWNYFQGEILGNFVQVQMLTVLVENVPDIVPYQYGSTFLSLVTLPVPSTVWPDKPLPSTGVLATYLWPEMWARSGTTLPPGLLGEWYLNFGFAGVFLGMMAFGAFYGVGRTWVVRSGSPFSRLVYGLQIGMMLHYLRGEFVAPTAMMLIFCIPAYFVIRMSRLRLQPPAVAGLPESWSAPKDIPALAARIHPPEGSRV